MVGRTLRTAFALTLGILAVELVGGIVSHSLALLSDAGHVFTDVIALGLAWFAAGQTERPANARKTFGYHRTGVLAALANAVTLIIVVGVIAVEAVLRLRHPEAVTPWVMFVSAGVGIAANLYIAFGLRREGGENLNARAALLHVVGDIGASAAVILSALVILLTGWYPADAILSLVIAALIARSAWGVLRETLDILMEATPRGLDVGAARARHPAYAGGQRRPRSARVDTHRRRLGALGARARAGSPRLGLRSAADDDHAYARRQIRHRPYDDPIRVRQLRPRRAVLQHVAGGAARPRARYGGCVRALRRRFTVGRRGRCHG